MPIRIVVVRSSDVCVLEVHGWLRSAEVEMFEQACVSQGLPLRIDLEHLVRVDAAGLQALHRKRARGVQFVGASPYIDLLMSRTADTNVRGGNGGT